MTQKTTAQLLKKASEFAERAAAQKAKTDKAFAAIKATVDSIAADTDAIIADCEAIEKHEQQ
jgi:cytochrome c556